MLKIGAVLGFDWTKFFEESGMSKYLEKDYIPITARIAEIKKNAKGKVTVCSAYESHCNGKDRCIRRDKGKGFTFIGKARRGKIYEGKIYCVKITDDKANGE